MRSLKKRRLSRLPFVLFLAAAALMARAGVRFAPPQLPPSAWADTEVSTNLVFDSGAAADNTFRLTIELDAAPSNCVQVAFGVDADRNGDLSLEEADFILGWSHGGWFFSDRRAEASDWVARSAGRRTLDWKLGLDGARNARSLEASDGGRVFSAAALPSFFSGGWNLAKVTARGSGEAVESIVGKTAPGGFAVRVR